MIRATIRKMDARGELPRVGSRGVGFAIVPALLKPPTVRPDAPMEFDARSLADMQARPGSYPVEVQLEGGQLISVYNGDSLYVDGGFRTFTVRGGYEGEVWLVYTFESRNDVRLPAGNKQRATVPMLISKPLVTDGPTVGASVLPTLPGLVSWSFYFQNLQAAERTVGVYQLTAGNQWLLVETIILPASEPLVQSRTVEVRVPGQALYLRQMDGTSGDVVVNVDAAIEVG